MDFLLFLFYKINYNMSDISLLIKYKEYNERNIAINIRRLDTLEEDKKTLGFTDEDIENIRVEDFEFKYIDKRRKTRRQQILLKDMSGLGTVVHIQHIGFLMRYKGILGGVIIMGMPNAFSTLLGEKKEIERLIARGASASWTPKNLGSHFLMMCIKWMVGKYTI